MCCCAALLLWVTTTMTRSGKTIEQMKETHKRHTPDLALLRPRCLRQRYRAKALRIQDRWPSVEVVHLELVKGVTGACLQRRYPLFGALSGCTHGCTSTSTSVSMRDPGPGTVRKTPQNPKIAIRLRRDPSMVCSDQCELCCGACC